MIGEVSSCKPREINLNIGLSKTIDTKVIRRSFALKGFDRLFILNGGKIMIKQVTRGELYYADLSPTIGSEQNGLRPVLIIQNDIANLNSPTTIVVAITSSKTKHTLPTHISFVIDCLKSESTVLLEQIRTIDKSRLGEYIEKMDHRTMKKIDRAILICFGIQYLGDC